MEQTLKYRLQARHEELLKFINLATKIKENIEEGGSLLHDLMEIKIKLKAALTSFEKENLRVLQYLNDQDFPHQEQYVRDEMRAEELLMDLQLIEEFNKSQPTANKTSGGTTKLPKLEMAKFDGDILKWPEFWAQFESSVHDQQLKKSDKLSYLFSAMAGPALEALRGIDITNENYDIALETLKRRFGNKDIVIDAHYDALTKLEIATDATAQSTLDSIQKHLRILSTLGEDVKGNYFRNLIYNKFPDSILYEMNLLLPKERTLNIILETLERIIQAKVCSREVTFVQPSTSTTEALHIKAVSKPVKRKYLERKDYINKCQTSFNKRKRIQCTFCDGDHFNDQCQQFRTVALRRRKLGLKRLCFKCFKTGHLQRMCTEQIVCFHCKGNHNRALCYSRNKMRLDRDVNKKVELSSKKPGLILESSSKEILNTLFNNNTLSFLQTAIATLQHEGQNLPVRLLLDCGSQRSYITAKIAKKLNIVSDENDHLLIYTFGSKTPQQITSPTAKITLITKRGIERELCVNIVPHITDMVRISKIPTDYSIDISADDDSLGEQIDLLIGNNYYFSFMKNQSIKINNDLHLINTHFGWIISGHSVDNNNMSIDLSIITYCQCYESPSYSYFSEPDLPLRNIDIQFLWCLESIGIVDSPKATQEEDAVKFFNETVKFKNNRYEVKWPWTEYPPVLPTNFGLAFGRLKGLLKRTDERMLKEYKEILQEQLQSGIIELVTLQTTPYHQTEPPIHYLPHHMVRQEGKKGRVVYDASSKVRDEHSLNECMYRGPSMLEDLTALLLQFRTGKIGITADVEKAFLQVVLQQEDRDVTRFLWVKDTSKELTEDNLLHYRFCRVPFGIISSPFLLNATLRYHLLKANQGLLKKIANRCYVDNLVTEVNTQSEALQLYTETKRTFEEISMNLRDWVSNDKIFLQSIPVEHRAKQSEEVKVLGLIWNTDSDTLCLKMPIQCQNPKGKAVTKKDILRTIARIYDPCGFASPWILPAKLLFQETCSLKLKWDNPIPVTLQQTWISIQDDLQTLQDIKISRYIGNKLHDAETCELHCFADASKKAYAAVVYFVSRSKSNMSTAFLMSKSRITPIEDKDELKIPRLELLAYLIGSRLLKYVADNLGVKIDNKYLWTDSLIVLAWMKTSKLLPPFVLRRVNEIKKNKDVHMCHVPTEHNPADVATRPEIIKQKFNLWLKGPEFLKNAKSKWPNRQVSNEEVFLSAAEALDVVDGPEMSSRGYEEIEEVITEIQMPELFNETEDETHQDIRKLQSVYFPEEVAGKLTSLSRNLGLYLDNNYILRCRGRMMNTEWTYDMKHPILIPKDCEFTDRLIQKIHEENYHVGVPHTLSLIREKYWIPQGRAKVQKVLKKCSRCVKHGGGPYKLPPTPALPVERVQLSSPFAFTGIDYFGPLFVQTSTSQKEKRWVSLFTCLTMRAIHLEVVQDLSATECLLGLRRFVAARGKPNLIVSDNASQFKVISEILADQGIKWKFIPQLAPWHGGVYERLIGIVKNCLKRTLDKHLLQDGQLLTVIKETESVVNSRPLTYVGTDVEQILRPADFLNLGNCLELVPIQELQLGGTAVKIDLLKSWKRGKMILNEVKSMFQGQYLPSLGERYRHHLKQPRITSSQQPRIGDVVQIKGESRNRNNWKVGKISALIEGQDGQTRVARVHVGDQEYTRSIGHLYPLEGDIEGPVTVSPPSVIYENEDRFEAPIQQTVNIESNGAEEDIAISVGNDPLPSIVEVETSPADDVSEVEAVVNQNPDHVRARREAAIRAREKIAE